MEQKELWPDAGLWLDFSSIETDAFDLMDAIGAHLDGLSTTQERILWIERFLIEYDDIIARHTLTRIKEIVCLKMANDPTADMFRYMVEMFQVGLQRRLKKQQAIRRLEMDQERARLYEAERAKKEDEDNLRLAALARQTGGATVDPEPTDGVDETARGKWSTEQAAESGMLPNTPASDARGKPAFTAAQSCLVIHYLVREAREIEKERRNEERLSGGVKETAEMIAEEEKTREKAFERLLVAMTGWDESTIRKGRGGMFTRRKQTPEDLRLVKPHFQSLGLSDIVKLIESAPTEPDDDDDDEF